MRKDCCIKWLSLMLAAGSVNGWCLDALSDEDMAAVSGRDGLVVSFTGDTVTADRLRWDVDSANAVLPASNAYLDLEGVTMTGIGADGATPGIPFTVSAAFDVGADAGGDAYVNLDTTWTRTRFQVDAMRHEGDPTKSIGSIAFDSAGSLSLFGQGSFLNNLSNEASARLILNDGQMFFRQNGSEFVADNIDVNVGFDSGSIGATTTGIRIATSRLDWNILFDMAFRESEATAFAGTGLMSYLRYGWQGGLTNFEARINGGGVWYGGDLNNRSEGLNISFRSDYASDFEWLIGDAGGPETLLRFQNWAKLPGAAYAINAPNITVDAINANQGPGGLTYQAGFYNVPPDAGALALIVRDLSFLAYNTQVTIEDAPFPDLVKQWGLVYTLGDLDANLYLYPGGRVSNEGARFDALVSVQSPGAWNQNSHFLIADTGADTGIGFLNTNFLVSRDDAYIEVVGFNDGDSTSCNGCGLRLDATAPTSDVRWRLNSQFGGGLLSDLSDPVRMVDIDLDLHADTIDLLFSPPDLGETRLKFQWDMRLLGDSYIAFSEPSAPDVKFTLGQISGDISARNGVIDIRSGNETADNAPRLVFEQDLLLGLTAGSQVLRINDLSIGTNNIGSIVMPGGQITGIFALKEQL